MIPVVFLKLEIFEWVKKNPLWSLVATSANALIYQEKKQTWEFNAPLVEEVNEEIFLRWLPYWTARDKKARTEPRIAVIFD